MNNLKMPLNKIEDLMNMVLDSGGEFTMIINGTSMLPLLTQGKDAVVLVKRKPEIQDVILYKRKDGSFVLHRIIGNENNCYVLCGDNQFVKEYGIKDIDVIAVMVAFIKKGKRTDIDDFRYRLYVRTLFLRRSYKKLKNDIRRKLKCRTKDNI